MSVNTAVSARARSRPVLTGARVLEGDVLVGELLALLAEVEVTPAGAFRQRGGEIYVAE
jgi:hypothetical protein